MIKPPKPRIRWVVTSNDKRKRRTCFACGARVFTGWSLPKWDEDDSRINVCMDCYQHWVAGGVREEIDGA